MVVSKEAGALLDLKCYGWVEQPILSLTVEDIQINKGISDDFFQLDVSGYREVSNKEFNISGIENYQEKLVG